MANHDDGIPLDVSLSPDSDRVGGRIGNYVLGAKLGQGGFGAVHRAHHVETENQVALKLLSADIVKRLPDVALRFQREAKAGNQINHRNIVKVLDFGNVDGQLFLTMELLDGVALDIEIKRKGAMPIPRALPILIQIAEALGAAHAKGFVHRDVKPPNVFLIDDPHPDFVKVLDFGIAKILSPSQSDPLHTATNAMMGSPPTMAPEQWKGSAIDHRADVYSLGVLSFYVLTGHYPFNGTQGELIAKHQLVPPPKVSDFILTSTGHLDAVIDRALAKSPEDRFQTMEEFREALSSCRTVAGAPPIARVDGTLNDVARSHAGTPAPIGAATATPTMNGQTRSPEGSKSRTGLLAGVAVAILVGAVGAYSLRTGEHDSSEAAAVRPNQKAAVVPSPTIGRARVVTVPPGATVSSGNKVLGVTPLDVEGTVGERLRLHFARAQYEPTEEEIIPEDPPSSIELELRALTAVPLIPASRQHAHRVTKRKEPAVDVRQAPPPVVKRHGSEDATANPFEGH